MWLGWLHLVDFETEGEVDHPFLIFDSEEVCFLFAESLQALLTNLAWDAPMLEETG